MNIGEVLLEALKAAGARAVFGIPGDYALPFFDVVADSRILPLHTFNHEPAVGHAADAAARHAGGLGVAAVTYGAGALSMVNAVACAWAERSRLVVISGAPATDETGRDLMLHHQIQRSGSQLHIFEEITCARTALDNPARAPKEISRVLRECLRQSRPVYIELPRNMVQAIGKSAPPVHVATVESALVERCAAAIGARIASARRPAILADVEIRRYGLEAEVLELAAKAGIPVATTFMGRGMFAGTPTPYIGNYLGAAGDSAIGDIIENSDCLVMLGVIACDTNLGMARKPIRLADSIRINEGSAVIAGEVFQDIGLGALLGILRKMLPARDFTAPLPAREELSAEAGDDILHADDVAQVINGQFARASKMPMAVDVGDCLFISMGVHDVPVLASGYYATMGFGIPAGMGLQAVTGERPLILVGDGGFQMTGWELMNCANSGLDPVVLLLNNKSWGMLKEIDPHASYTSRHGVSYAALAETLGGTGYKASTPRQLAAALKTACATRGKFQLIEAILPEEDVSTVLKRYIAAMKSGMALQAAA